MTDWHERFRIRKRKTDPRRLAYLALILFADPSGVSLAIGSVLVVSAVGLHGWAAGYLARASAGSRETELTVAGPYRHTRNPFYLAHMVMDVGFFVAAGLGPFALVYMPFIFLVYRRCVREEEAFLEEEFGEAFRLYKQRVPRWGFRLSPAPAMGREESFTLEDYRLNAEGPRTVAHLLLLVLFWGLFLFSNPLFQLPYLARITILLAATTYWLLRDARIRTDRDWSVNPAWMIGGTTVLLLGAGALIWTPSFWTLWPTDLRSELVALGILLGIVGTGRGFGPLFHNLKSICVNLFPVPDLPYLFMLLGLGLVTGRFAGVWMALLLGMFLWSLQATLGKRLPWPRAKVSVLYLLLMIDVFS